MGNKRHDGYFIKNIEPMLKLMPHVMPRKYDALVATDIEVDCTAIDEFIKKTREETGVVYSYIHIIYAGIVRMYSQKPKINRFIMNRKIFAHNDVTISTTVKKSLRENAEDSVVKLHLSGWETLPEIRDYINRDFTEAAKTTSANDTDDVSNFLGSASNWLIKLCVGLIKWMDLHNIVPKMLVDVSPFHCSCYVTLMKTIKLDSIHHHLYDFGTSGLFVAPGKEKLTPIVDRDGEIVAKKIMKVGIVLDERVSDGLYWGNAVAVFNKMMANPELLMTPPEYVYHDIGKGEPAPQTMEQHNVEVAEEQARLAKKNRKANKKAAKQAAKIAKKEAKLQQQNNKKVS